MRQRIDLGTFVAKASVIEFSCLEASMKRAVFVLATIAAFALPSLASAEQEHNSKKAKFHFENAVVVGSQTVQPGYYQLQCKMIDGEHVMVVMSDDGKEVARVPCKPETLDKKVTISEFRTINGPGGSKILSSVRFDGETTVHRTASPVS